MIEPTLPGPQKPHAPSQFNVAIGQEAASQATLIIKTHALGYLIPKFYQIPNQEKISQEQDAHDEGMKNRKLGEFGNPVFDSFTFAKKDWTTTDGQQLSVPELALGTVLVEVNQTKNIVETFIQGRATGSVKEWASDGDYMITLRGVLLSNAQDVYPTEQVRHLRDFFRVNESLQVGSDYLANWNITDIVVKSFSIGQEEGNRSVQRFEVQAVSDYPFEVKGKKI